VPIVPLHERDTVREQLDECVFVGHDMTREVPKYRFPAQESPAREAYQVVADELMLADLWNAPDAGNAVGGPRPSGPDLGRLTSSSA
jgi:hypothetical protein